MHKQICSCLFCIVLLSSLLVCSAYSQDTLVVNKQSKSIDLENVKKMLEREIKDQFPRTRFLDVHLRRFTPSNFETKGFREGKTKGKSHNGHNIEASLNLPVVNKTKFKLLVIGRYDFDNLDIKEHRYKASGVPVEPARAKYKSHLYSTGLQGFYLFSIKDKAAVASINLVGEGSAKGYERVVGYLYGSLILSQDRNSSMSVGFIGLLDNKTSIPVLPSFSYSKRLQNGWTFELFLPKHIYVRRAVLKNSRITMGSEVGSNNVYLEAADGKMYMHKINHFKAMLFYEHQFSEKFIYSTGIELLNSFGGKVIPSDKSHNKYVLKTSKNMNFNIQASISYSFFGGR